MVAVPLQIQVSVSGLSVYCCIETAIMSRDDQDIQEGHGAIWPGVFSSELNTCIVPHALMFFSMVMSLL